MNFCFSWQYIWLTIIWGRNVFTGRIVYSWGQQCFVVVGVGSEQGFNIHLYHIGLRVCQSTSVYSVGMSPNSTGLFHLLSVKSNWYLYIYILAMVVFAYFVKGEAQCFTEIFCHGVSILSVLSLVWEQGCVAGGNHSFLIWLWTSAEVTK